MDPSQNSSANRTVGPNDTRAGTKGNNKTSRRAAANRANARKSTGPRTAPGRERVTQNLPTASSARLLGLVEARVLKQVPGAAEMLYRQLIAPYGPEVPALLALHFQDLARLQLELQGLEQIRDAQMDHRAQQTAIMVRRLNREMDRELRVAPRDVFEKGLYSMEECPAKFRMQFDALIVLRGALQRRELGAMETTLRQLYGNALDPAYERGRLICIDCRRLMDPNSEPFSDEDTKLLSGLVEREIEDAMEGYGLELDGRTKTAEARLADLAPSRQDHWMSVQEDRLRRAIDRKQWVITGLLQTLKLSQKAASGPTGVTADDENEGTPHPI